MKPMKSAATSDDERLPPELAALGSLLLDRWKASLKASIVGSVLVIRNLYSNLQEEVVNKHPVEKINIFCYAYFLYNHTAARTIAREDQN